MPLMYIYIYIYICMCIYVYMYMFMCVYIYMYIVFIYTYTYVHIWICVHIHMSFGQLSIWYIQIPNVLISGLRKSNYTYIHILQGGETIGCHIFSGHFLQKSPIINSSFAERDLQLQLKASNASSPPCTCIRTSESLLHTHPPLEGSFLSFFLGFWIHKFSTELSGRWALDESLVLKDVYMQKSPTTIHLFWKRIPQWQ